MKHLIRRLMPASTLLRRANKRTIMQFAENVGLVYFGVVDQQSDDHPLIRGLTLSRHHRDNHYCVGSLYNYDIALVERTDVIRFPGKPNRDQVWLIMQFDLHTTADLPHIFLGLHTHSETFYANLFATFGQMQRAPLGTFGMYDKSFLDRYAIYTSPAESLTAERLFDNEMTKMLAAHFGSLTIEVVDGSLYLYSEHRRITQSLLETMLKNGAWLAKHLDDRAAHI